MAVDDNAAVAPGPPAGRCDDAAAGGGLDLVQVGAAPGPVGGEGLDPGRMASEVERQVGEHASLPSGCFGVEVGDAEDDAVVGERGPDRGALMGSAGAVWQARFW